jgi:RimJ/RimL family protein N-acetyltransferase
MQQLETQHLLLRPFTLEMKKVALSNRPRLAELINAKVPAAWPQEDFADALPFFIERMEQDGSGAVWDGIILHKQDRVVIGDMGFKGGPDEAGAVEIGYSIIPKYRQHGYATEMAQRLVAWAFQQPDISAVIAECLDDNIGSIKVLEKLGMRRVAQDTNMIQWEIRKGG